MRLVWLLVFPLLLGGCSSPVARQIGVTGPSRTEQLNQGVRQLPAGAAVYWLGPAASVFWTFGSPLPDTPWICQEPSVPGRGRVAFCVVTHLQGRPAPAFHPGEYQEGTRLRRGRRGGTLHARRPAGEAA